MTGEARQRIVVDGEAIEVCRHGPPPGVAPTIVMLHDETWDHPAWRSFAERLAGSTGCGALRYDGPSGADPTADALHTLPAILAGTAFERGLLLGHGRGAAAATIYAGGVQDHRVRGLVLIAPWFSPGPTDAPVPTLEEDGPDLRVYLGYLRVPMLVIRGARDSRSSADQAEVARDESYAPVDVVEIAGAGTAPHADRADATLAAVSDFVATLLHTFGEAAAPRGGALDAR